MIGNRIGKLVIDKEHKFPEAIHNCILSWDTGKFLVLVPAMEGDTYQFDLIEILEKKEIHRDLEI